MIENSTPNSNGDSRRAFLERAGKAGAGAAATTMVVATMKPGKAAAHYSHPTDNTPRHHKRH